MATSRRTNDRFYPYFVFVVCRLMIRFHNLEETQLDPMIQIFVIGDSRTFLCSDGKFFLSNFFKIPS